MGAVVRGHRRAKGSATGGSRLRRLSSALPFAVAIALWAAPPPALAFEPNPFLPPAQRGDDMEARLQTRIDRAVAAAEDRLLKAVVDALNGRDITGAPKPLQDAVRRPGPTPSAPAMAAPYAPPPLPGAAAPVAAPVAANTSLPPGLPGLPPLPSFAGSAGSGPPPPPPPQTMGMAATGSDPVPPGAVFIGCLDGQAFFQDRAGSPFLVDPRAFPPSSGGAGACGR